MAKELDNKKMWATILEKTSYMSSKIKFSKFELVGLIDSALRKQGFEYKDGDIVPIAENKGNNGGISPNELCEDEKVRKELLLDIPKVFSYDKAFRYIAWVKKQGEQTETICDKCRKEHPSHSCQDITALGRCAVEHEQKPWSEEDISKIDRLIRYFKGKDNKEFTEWFSLLKDRVLPQPTWKPSDEQMEALESATENCAYSEYQDCLRELIDQLKKLREE